MSNCNRLTTLFPSAMLEEHAEGTERNNNIGRAQRFQVLYTFLRSMWVLLIGGALLHGLGLIAFWCVGYNVLWTPLQSSVIIISLAGIDVITYLRRVKYHDIMVDALIFDFYANVLTDEDETDL